ncbi:hypothetical protein JZU46_05595 [bacterium]|jgi:hypothetical protein|nr:hypothetical protein [bacterium]
MQKPNFGGVNFYSLSKPVAIKIEGCYIPTIPEVADLSHKGLAPPPAQSTETRPVVIITGRGRTEGRVPTLVRLQPEVVKEIKCLVDGPLYLTIELALRHYAKDLRTRKAGSVEMIKAADLG